MIAPVIAALHCACAEAMYDGKTLAPPLDARVADDWQILWHLTAADALFSLQALGLGERVYYGYFAVSKTNPLQFIIVLRGTENAHEWFIDFEGMPVPAETLHDGRVEQGFYSIHLSMLLRDLIVIRSADVDAEIDQAIPAGATVTVMGHSLGAPLAAYRAKSLAQLSRGRYLVQSLMFASPKPGDATFAQAFDAIVGHFNYVVYNYNRDFVPHAPPSLFGFSDLSSRILITPATAKYIPPFDLKANHAAINYARMLGYTGE